MNLGLQLDDLGRLCLVGSLVLVILGHQLRDLFLEEGLVHLQHVLGSVEIVVERFDLGLRGTDGLERLGLVFHQAANGFQLQRASQETEEESAGGRGGYLLSQFEILCLHRIASLGFVLALPPLRDLRFQSRGELRHVFLSDPLVQSSRLCSSLGVFSCSRQDLLLSLQRSCVHLQGDVNFFQLLLRNQELASQGNVDLCGSKEG
jgi:hypothetical protein